jgi:hypothetical protein
MEHPLRCRCGTVKGFVANAQLINRTVCYCRDCQAFAHFLAREGEILDTLGGTDVIQVLPGNVAFTEGSEALACVRLTDKGMLRWYAGCCKTPVGNTLADFKISFVGLVHNCLEAEAPPLQDSFGPVRAWMNTKGARVNPTPRTVGAGRLLWRLFAATAKARITGGYQSNPFFHADGTPIVSARILSSTELAQLMQAVQNAGHTFGGRRS